LLQLVGETLRDNLRPYDVIVRFGGDEFLCAMPNIHGSEASKRMETIATALTAASHGQSITFGLAQHDSADGLDELIRRADESLLARRQGGE
jgi:diguanylate cyclase (GGDEF)-like protein